MATVLGMAVPQALGALSRVRTLAAARFLAARFQAARGMAASTSTYTAVRLRAQADDVLVGGFRDGNHNGVRTADIAAGIDAAAAAEVGLAELFPHVAVVMADGQTPVPAGDVRVFSFAPSGTATSGTVYLRGDRDGRFAVRVLGATGRVRVLRFRPATADWVDLR